MISSPRLDEDLLVVQVFEQARKCYEDVGLEIEIYKQRVLEILMKYSTEPPNTLARVNLLSRIHTNDLYLTTACAQGNEVAWQRFDQTYRSQVYRLARSFSTTVDLGDELAGSLLADLFFTDQSNRPRIASYEGLGSLNRWLRIVVAHRAANERERKWNQVEGLAQAQEVIEQCYVKRLEARMRANRYTALIGDALRQASRTLNERERLILLMKYDEALSSKEVAATLGVQPPRVTQLLQQIRQKIKQGVIEILSQKYKLSREAIEECLTDLAENPEHSIVESLKAS